MTKDEAITVIQKIVDSLKERPYQFQLNVNVGNIQGTVQGCGIYNVIYNGHDMNATVTQEIDQNITDKMQVVIDSLNGIITELRSNTPNQGRISAFLQSLRDNLLAGAIITAVTTVLNLALTPAVAY
jgi:hypothetical protein